MSKESRVGGSECVHVGTPLPLLRCLTSLTGEGFRDDGRGQVQFTGPARAVTIAFEKGSRSRGTRDVMICPSITTGSSR